MTPEERYLFDVQGYLVLRGVLSPDMCHRLNETIDHLETLSRDEVVALGAARKYREPDNVYAKVGTPSAGDLGDYDCEVLRYGGPFEELIDWSHTLPYIEQMIGEPCRLDAASFMSRNSGGAFRFHHGYAELLPYSEYAFQDGEFKCVSAKIGYALTDVDVEDGCFAVIPGSHKSNFTNPLVGQVPDPGHPLVQPLPCKAGDAVIFSEDLSHGAVENRSLKVRRTLFYSYAPAFHCAWHDLAMTAEGFEKRANRRRLELIQGPSPFAAPVVGADAH
ncbi:MAG: phytanoyl-CoA dioxygenase family protein [Candidatus Poribacteria bacterium]|nr:phytanoyl-CoA dioxygenase family protein [Candidatus Poribacteria bacterium]